MRCRHLGPRFFACGNRTAMREGGLSRARGERCRVLQLKSTQTNVTSRSKFCAATRRPQVGHCAFLM